MSEYINTIAAQIYVEKDKREQWSETLHSAAQTAQPADDVLGTFLGRIRESGSFDSQSYEIQSLIESYGWQAQEVVNGILDNHPSTIATLLNDAHGDAAETGSASDSGAEAAQDPEAGWAQFVQQASGTYYGDEESWQGWLEWAQQTADYYGAGDRLREIVGHIDNGADKRETLTSYGIAVGG